MFELLPPRDICQALGARVRIRRLAANFTQAELAARVGCSLSSIRRLEARGQATLELLVGVAQVLQAVDGFGALLALPQGSIAQLEAADQALQRQRARAPSRSKP